MREWSSLTSSISLSPNNSGTRTMSIDRITPHCIVGQASEARCRELFTDPSRQASSNYCISYDGKVVGVVPETKRSWCSSSSANDQRAITIECASDSTDPYAFKDACYRTLVDLCVDICKAYNKTKLLWISDKNSALNYSPKSNEMLLTVHRWFAQKSCPGNWMFARMGNLADEVTRRLGSEPQPQPQPTNTEVYLWNAFNYLGNYGCAGLLANLKCESAYKSTNLQGSFEKKFGMDDETYTAAVDNNAWDFVHDSAGYGLAQWTYYSRKQDLLNYAKSKNVSIGDLNMQIEFCKKELDGYKLTDKLNNCKSAKEASDLVMTVYEKPADQSEAALKKRSDIAEQIYNTYTGTKPSKNYLEKGDSGEDVKVMQTMLIKCGYSCGNSGADGIFGSNTDKAVRAFQAAKNLDVDGLYGPKTKAALEAEYNKSELYRVRKSWEDSKSQIGAYRVYDNAVKQCNEHPGYSVYDSNGKCVYTTKKSNEDIAKEVIQGKWGNGTERKQRLTAAGYDYSTVQNIVNQMLK